MSHGFDWWSCDGRGSSGSAPASPRPSRRQIIGGALATALAAWAGRSALADVKVAQNDEVGGPGDVLVVVFLRGGMDGLSLVVPHGDDAYYRARPTLALGAPRKGGAGGTALDLDGFFGLHPAAKGLHPLYQEGLLAAVQAIGSADQTRSHFEAMAAMERGLAGGDAQTGTAGAASGWLARYLYAAPVADASPLRAVAFSHIMPDTLRGATNAPLLTTLADYKLHSPGEAYATSLASLYADGSDDSARAGRAILKVLETLKRLDPAAYAPGNGAKYPDTELGGGMKQVACLIKAGVGLEAAFLDRGGWDTHVAQGGATGMLAGNIQDVADSVTAFARDLGTAGLAKVTVVVQTEFGRRLVENSGLGTDHGRASAMLLLGGGIHGGKVYGNWPGLASDKLEPPGDLRVTTDYRTVLSEIVDRRMRRSVGGPPVARAIFPDAAPVPYLGVAKPG